MKSSCRLHWLPPPAHHSSVLETVDYRRGLGFLGCLGAASLAVQYALGTLSVSGVLGIGLSIAFAALSAQTFMASDGTLKLTRATWWRLIQRAVLMGAGGMVVGLGILLAGSSPGATGQGLHLSVFMATLSAAVMAPASVVILMARMRDEHEKRYPLSGEGGDLEA